MFIFSAFATTSAETLVSNGIALPSEMAILSLPTFMANENDEIIFSDGLSLNSDDLDNSAYVSDGEFFHHIDLSVDCHMKISFATLKILVLTLNVFFCYFPAADLTRSEEEILSDSDCNRLEIGKRKMRKVSRKTLCGENYPLNLNKRCSCKRNCLSLISDNDRAENHKNYWKSKSSTSRRNYMSNYVEMALKSRNRSKSLENHFRKFTYTCHLSQSINISKTISTSLQNFFFTYSWI